MCKRCRTCANDTKTLEKKAIKEQGHVLARSPRNAAAPMRFLAIRSSFERRWALREVKAHEPIQMTRLTRAKRKTPTHCSGYTNDKKKGQGAKRAQFRSATLLYHRKGHVKRTLSHQTRHNSHAKTEREGNDHNCAQPAESGCHAEHPHRASLLEHATRQRTPPFAAACRANRAKRRY